MIEWNEERDNTLRKLRDDRLGFYRCGLALGVTEYAARNRARALGLPALLPVLSTGRLRGLRAKWTDAERQEVLELYTICNWSCRRIGRHIGKSNWAVIVEIKRQGRYLPGRRDQCVEYDEDSWGKEAKAGDNRFQTAMQAAGYRRRVDRP